jgi:hypothetical protein
MSEFDKLKDEAEKEMKEHPEQVKEGQQAVEKSSPGPPVRTGTTRQCAARRPGRPVVGRVTPQPRDVALRCSGRSAASSPHWWRPGRVSGTPAGRAARHQAARQP